MRRTQAVVFSWLTAGCYAAFIFSLSAIPAQHFPDSALTGLDKAAHLLEYIPLGLLLMRALAFTRRTSRIQSLLITVFVIMLYALTDEFHQSFVPGRTSDWMDGLMDVAGGAIGSGLYRWRG